MRLGGWVSEGLCWQLRLSPLPSHSLRCVALCCVLSVVSSSMRPCGLSPPGRILGGLPCPPGDHPHPGTEPASLRSPASGSRFFTSAAWEFTILCYFLCLPWINLGSSYFVLLSLSCVPSIIVSVIALSPCLYQASGSLAQGTYPARLFPFSLICCYSSSFFLFFFRFKIDLQYCVGFSYTHIYSDSFPL